MKPLFQRINVTNPWRACKAFWNLPGLTMLLPLSADTFSSPYCCQPGQAQRPPCPYQGKLGDPSSCIIAYDLAGRKHRHRPNSPEQVICAFIYLSIHPPVHHHPFTHPSTHSNILPSIHPSMLQVLLYNYYMPDVVLGTEDAGVSETKRCLWHQ